MLESTIINTLLHKIAAVMVVVIDLPAFSYFLHYVVELYDAQVNFTIAFGVLLVQQYLIVAILLCTREVCNLCNERFLSDLKHYYIQPCVYMYVIIKS